jgi:hypothetical protein
LNLLMKAGLRNSIWTFKLRWYKLKLTEVTSYTKKI